MRSSGRRAAGSNIEPANFMTSALICPRQFRNVDGVVLGDPPDLADLGVPGRVQLVDVERRELEVIVVGAMARWRGGAVVAPLAEIVDPRPIRLPVALPLGQRACPGIDVVE